MNYADIKLYDVANGSGIRTSLFVSGCSHHCKNCFNPETWDFNYGKPFTDKEMEYVIESCRPDHIAGLSVLGGEPMEFVNQQGILPLLKLFKKTFPEKTVWVYTGFDYEKDILGKMINLWDYTSELLTYIDILVDGEFVEELKDLNIRFRGSSNQRIIDVKASLAKGEVVLWDEKGRFF